MTASPNGTRPPEQGRLGWAGSLAWVLVAAALVLTVASHLNGNQEALDMAHETVAEGRAWLTEVYVAARHTFYSAPTAGEPVNGVNGENGFAENGVAEQRSPENGGNGVEANGVAENGYGENGLAENGAEERETGDLALRDAGVMAPAVFGKPAGTEAYAAAKMTVPPNSALAVQMRIMSAKEPVPTAPPVTSENMVTMPGFSEHPDYHGWIISSPKYKEHPGPKAQGPRDAPAPWQQYFMDHGWPQGQYIPSTLPAEHIHFGLWCPMHSDDISPDKGWGIEFIGEGLDL